MRIPFILFSLRNNFAFLPKIVANPVGSGDIHDNRYENLVKLATFTNDTLITDGTVDGLEIDLTGCFQTISFYPTEVRIFIRLYVFCFLFSH